MSASPLPSASSATLSFSSTSNSNVISEWRTLYLTALFETDKSRLPGRILRAERALIRREHELFESGGTTEEKTIVNNALHALHALRGCLGLT